MVVIWNPSIMKSVGIVVPCHLEHLSGKITHFGFGVSPSTYDPTIVAISRGLQERRHYEVGFFTLSSKKWKMIPTSNVPRDSVSFLYSTQVAIDRFIFWAAIHRKHLILSFDLITHEFKEINLPDNIANFPGCFSISKIRESLVVSTTVDERVYGVWMMVEEGGGMTSFTKLFTINTPHSSLVREVLGYKKSGEPMIETQKDDQGFTKFKVYDPCSQHINDDFGITGASGSFFISPYTETLLLTDHSDGCIIPTNY